MRPIPVVFILGAVYYLLTLSGFVFHSTWSSRSCLTIDNLRTTSWPCETVYRRKRLEKLNSLFPHMFARGFGPRHHALLFPLPHRFYCFPRRVCEFSPQPWKLARTLVLTPSFYPLRWLPPPESLLASLIARWGLF